MSYTEERIRVINEAVEVLNVVYAFCAKERKEDTVKVYVKPEELAAGREIIHVQIGGSHYTVNVECDSVTAMIRQVIDETILKI